jgi:hypothetical protein
MLQREGEPVDYKVSGSALGHPALRRKTLLREEPKTQETAGGDERHVLGIKQRRIAALEKSKLLKVLENQRLEHPIG